MKQYIVDAIEARGFEGAPVVNCALKDWNSDEQMENDFPESGCPLCWFSLGGESYDN